MPAIAQRSGMRGNSMVEILVACVLLAVLAVAGMTALYEAGGALEIHKNHRIALGIANSRLEELRSMPYTLLTGLIPKNYNTNAIAKVGGQFALAYGETVPIGGKPMPISTSLQYVDIDAGTNTYDYLRMTVSVQYRTANEQVTLQTLRGH